MVSMTIYWETCKIHETVYSNMAPVKEEMPAGNKGMEVGN